MADQIGTITVPAPAKAAEKFPIISDFGYGQARQPDVAVHEFGTANNKIEQRFLRGPKARRFTVTRRGMAGTDQQALLDFWNARQGPYQSFDYDAPATSDPNAVETVECIFAEEVLNFNFLSSCIATTGIELMEVPAPRAPLPLNGIEERFPSAALESALLDQTQEVIPLVYIQVPDSGYPDNIYLSDRRVTIGAQEYLPRLLDWSPITQSMNGEADNTTFGFGNADRVMRDLGWSTNLRNSKIQFSLYHVGTGIRLDFWKGTVLGTAGDATNRFSLQCSDFLHELSLDYPARILDRACWKVFDDGSNCPYSTVNPGGPETECDKSWGNCKARNMNPYFGGVMLQPQKIVFKDNSTGTWGIGRETITGVGSVNESMYGRKLQQVWSAEPIKVACQMATGREEGDFYSAIGVVSEGPIGDYDNSDVKEHRLDGQPAHDPRLASSGPVWQGLRQSRGHDPAIANDPHPDSEWFSIGSGNPPVYEEWQAAGVAFTDIRRVDEEGRQLSLSANHEMVVKLLKGMSGFTWNTPGSRNTVIGLGNPVWIAISTMLRAMNLNNSTASDQEEFFDVESAIAAAAVCDLTVDKIIGTGTETQYRFSGVLGAGRPFRQWLGEILWTCLGYYAQVNGRLKVGLRYNSSALQAFTEGNIIYNSLALSSITPQFNQLTGIYADSEFDWKPNPVTVEDIDAAAEAGTPSNPRWLSKQVNLVGVFTPSQAARVVMTRLREEQGGITAEERRFARQGSWKTTILGLAVEPGMVVSLTHPDTTGAHEFRVQRIRLYPDMSVDVDVKTVTDSMYDMTKGPKPDDVLPDPLPAERVEVMLPMQPWFPNTVQPQIGDPLYDGAELNFALGQTYETQADGTALMRVLVEGEYPRTVVLDDQPPIITQVSQQTTGGSLPGGAFVTFAVAALNAAGESTRVSTAMTVPVNEGTNTNQLTIEVTWPSGFAGYRVYASQDDGIVSLQLEQLASQPASVILRDTDNYRTKGIEQENLARLQPKGTECIHGGISGFQVQGVALNSITTDRTDLTPDAYAGRILQIVADQSDVQPGGDGITPLLNFTVTGNTASDLSLSPDPLAAGVTIADVAILATKASIFTANTIGDDDFLSPWNPAGLIPEDERGTVVRIVQGTGKEQERTVIGNTDRGYTIQGTWDTTPDNTSVFMVLKAAPEYGVEAPWTDETLEGTQKFFIPAANLAAKTWWISVGTIGRKGREPERRYNPWRLLYVFGAPGLFGGWATIPSGDDVTPELGDGRTEQILLDRPSTNIHAAVLNGAPPPAGFEFTLKLKQDATGSRVVVWDALYVGAQQPGEQPDTVSTYAFVTNDVGQFTLKSPPVIGGAA